MDKIKRITIDQLEVGMYITQVNDEWAAETNLKAQGLITKPETVKKFQSMGFGQLYIDVEKGKDCVLGIPQSTIQKNHTNELANINPSLHFTVPRVSFDKERETALEIRSRALELVGNVMTDVKMGRSFDEHAVHAITDDINSSLLNNPNALGSLMRMREKDQYLLEHSMNVAVLMGLLARSMGINGIELHELVFGALVHDVGKIRVAESILYKPGRLDLDEWDEMKRHVTYGENSLAQIEGLPKVVMDICAQHHERLDGTGYPRGLPANAITRHGRMAAVVDVYDAITAERVYHSGMEPTVALKKMLEWSDNHLERALVYQLIRCISIYPAGATVKLKSGHLAIVQEANHQQPDRPRVKLIYDIKRKSKLSPKVVSLSDSQIYGAIVGAVSAEDYGLNLQDYL